MWHRPLAEGEPGLGSARGAAGLETRCRRAYFRVSGWLPIRLSPIAPASIDASSACHDAPAYGRTPCSASNAVTQKPN